MKGVVSVAGPRVLTPLQHHSSGEAATDTSYCFLSLPKQTQPGLPLHCPTTRRLIPGDPPPATTGTERRGTVNGSVWTHTFPPFGTSASLASLPQGLRGVEARPGFSHAILLLWAIIFHVGESHLILESFKQFLHQLIHLLLGDPHGPVSAEILCVGFIKVFQEVIFWIVIVIGLI